jgi:ribonucleoside-diphosphate reductase beta chain
MNPLPRKFGHREVFVRLYVCVELQDVQELTNFFERRVSAYQVGIAGDVGFPTEF